MLRLLKRVDSKEVVSLQVIQSEQVDCSCVALLRRRWHLLQEGLPAARSASINSGGDHAPSFVDKQ